MLRDFQTFVAEIVHVSGARRLDVSIFVAVLF